MFDLDCLLNIFSPSISFVLVLVLAPCVGCLCHLPFKWKIYRWLFYFNVSICFASTFDSDSIFQEYCKQFRFGCHINFVIAFSQPNSSMFVYFHWSLSIYFSIISNLIDMMCATYSQYDDDDDDDVANNKQESPTISMG